MGLCSKEISSGLSQIYAQMDHVVLAIKNGESGCRERAALALLECKQAALHARDRKDTMRGAGKA